MEQIDSTTYREIINSDKLTLIKYSANAWCTPCRVLTPIIEDVIKNYGDTINACEVDIDTHQDLAVNDGVRGVPTIVFYKKGVAIDRLVGVRPANEYVQKIDNLK